MISTAMLQSLLAFSYLSEVIYRITVIFAIMQNSSWRQCGGGKRVVHCYCEAVRVIKVQIATHFAFKG